MSSEKFKMDYYRLHKTNPKGMKFILSLIRQPRVLFLFLSRHAEGSGIKPRIFSTISKIYGRKYGLEMQTSNIGPGLVLGHAFCITINEQSSIGKNCSIHKGATIGQQSRGKKMGSPCIGDNVWIGVNSTIVGNVKIGNDVLIAPNTYVNFDVPDHSIVIGQSAIVKNKVGATTGYILNQIGDKL